jgi:hypothetical protein
MLAQPGCPAFTKIFHKPAITRMARMRGMRPPAVPPAWTVTFVSTVDWARREPEVNREAMTARRAVFEREEEVMDLEGY